jgi:hypothetical protein
VTCIQTANWQKHAMTSRAPHTRRKLLAFAITAIALPAAAFAQESRKVKFPPGDESVTLESKITGHDYFDYHIGAKAGQTLEVVVLGSSEVYYNVIPPNEDVIAIYNSSDHYDTVASIKLPKTGDYTIRVYLRGEDKDADHTVRYMMRLTIPSGIGQ